MTFSAYARKIGTNLYGDKDPLEFSFDMHLSADDMLKLYKRNEFIQVACEWAVIESNRQWITFNKKQTNISANKFNKPYVFADFEEYLKWIDFKSKDQQAKTWARLFGNSIMVFFDSSNGTKNKENEIVLSANPKGVYSDCKPYHPLCNTSDGQCGYEINEVDDDGNAKSYKIQIFTKGMKKAKKIIVDADRVVEYNAPAKEIKYGGSSRVEGLALIALAEEQTFKRLMKRAHDVAGGILTITGVSSDDEAKQIDAQIGDDISSIDRLFLQSGREVEYKTPDLKAAGEFDVIFNIFNKKLARHLRMSQQTLDGAPEGTISSAKYNMITSYVEILGIQEHYSNAMEKCFHKLGKENTTFIWNEILPDEMQTAPDFKIEHNWNDNSQNESADKEEEKEIDDQSKEKEDKNNGKNSK